MLWISGTAKAQGASHVTQGIPCQDRALYYPDAPNPLIVIGVIADGVGSARYGEEGAEHTVRTVKRELNRLIVQPSYQNPDYPQPTQAETQQLFAEIVKTLHIKLTQVAQDKGCPIKELACTLLAFVAHAHWFIAMQIGDGFIVVRSPENKEYRLLFQPNLEKGEFVNQTRVIITPNVLTALQCVSLPRVDFVCAATDGLERVALKHGHGDWSAPSPFFSGFEIHFLETYLKGTEQTDIAKQLNQDIKSYLISDQFDEDIDDDDKAIVCSVWCENKSHTQKRIDCLHRAVDAYRQTSTRPDVVEPPVASPSAAISIPTSSNSKTQETEKKSLKSRKRWQKAFPGLISIILVVILMLIRCCITILTMIANFINHLLRGLS